MTLCECVGVCCVLRAWVEVWVVRARTCLRLCDWALISVQVLNLTFKYFSGARINWSLVIGAVECAHREAAAGFNAAQHTNEDWERTGTAIGSCAVGQLWAIFLRYVVWSLSIWKCHCNQWLLLCSIPASFTCSPCEHLLLRFFLVYFKRQCFSPLHLLSRL